MHPWLNNLRQAFAVGCCSAALVLLASGSAQDQMYIPRGQPATIDGKVSAGEWGDSQSVNIPIRPDWNVRIGLKHDDQNLYLLFDGVTHDNERLFPEVFLNPQNRRGARWQKGEWWFHVSQNLCEGDGAPNMYRRNSVFLCAHQKAGWDANNPPGQNTQIEIRIAFSKIKLVPKSGRCFGIALAMTDATGDARQRWFLWPEKAMVRDPNTWGVAILSGNASAPPKINGALRSAPVHRISPLPPNESPLV